MLVDTHCHLDDKSFDADRVEVIERARAAGVGLMINIGGTLAGSRRGVELAAAEQGIYATVGIDPFGARERQTGDIEAVGALAEKEGVVGIGEIGLDYHHRHTSAEDQAEVLMEMLELAVAQGLPVSLHCREAHSEMLSILEGARELSGVMHCFSGDEADLARVLGMGLYISAGGPLSYSRSRSLRSMVKEMPRDKFLLETDSPYLPPQGHRGERNEPAYLPLVSETLAGEWDISRQEADELTTRNARRLFGLGEAPGTVAYRTKESVYVNLTNRCTSRCVFCHREEAPVINGQDLRLRREPCAREVREALREDRESEEVVFCGYGEPLLRLGLVKTIAGELKQAGRRIRVNTNGLAELYHGRAVTPELKGLVDEISISLNSADAGQYSKLCRPQEGERAFPALVDFIKGAAKNIPVVTATAVEYPGVDTEACARLAKELGAEFRVRKLVE